MERATYDNMRALQESHWWFRGRREILSDQLARLNLPRDGRILEVGCGPGGNLAMLAEFGQVTGLEPDEPSRRHAEAASGVTVHGGSLPGPLPDLGAPFDLVAAFDVIEHLEDGRGAVAALGKLLKPGGRLLATVPAHPWLWGAHDVAAHHRRRYRRRDFLQLFEAAGLRVVRASYFNTLLFPPIALLRLARGGGGEGSDVVPAGPMNGLLTRVFASEKHLLRIGDLPFGVSLLVLAEAPA